MAPPFWLIVRTRLALSISFLVLCGCNIKVENLDQVPLGLYISSDGNEYIEIKSQNQVAFHLKNRALGRGIVDKTDTCYLYTDTNTGKSYIAQSGTTSVDAAYGIRQYQYEWKNKTIVVSEQGTGKIIVLLILSPQGRNLLP